MQMSFVLGNSVLVPCVTCGIMLSACSVYSFGLFAIFPDYFIPRGKIAKRGKPSDEGTGFTETARNVKSAHVY